MKKLILVTSMFVALSLKAASVSVVLPSATASNILTVLGTNASSKITGVSLTGTTTNAPVVYFYDAIDSTFSVSNATYNVGATYVTNYVTWYTNYNNRTNFLTNIALVDITNTVASATNSLAPSFIAITPTNTTTAYSQLNIQFNRGIWVTNTVVGAAIFTITYTQ